MTEKFFLDSNIFIYLFNHTEPEKRKKCIDLISSPGSLGRIAISTQVLNEVGAVLIRKFKIDPVKVKSILKDIADFELVQVSLLIIMEGIDIMILNKLSYWDIKCCNKRKVQCDLFRRHGP